MFNRIASTISTSVGTFGNRYLFYLLDDNINGILSIIAEQIRYNNELVEN